MKALNFSYVFFVIFALTNTTLSAQKKDYITISLSMVTDGDEHLQSANKATAKKPIINNPEPDLSPKGNSEEVIPHYFRSHKALPKLFSGYAIELLQSDQPLPRNYPLFERFGSIHVHQLDNGNYSYCIIADFKKLKRVEIFVQEVILPSAPHAQVFIYKKGARKKK